MDDLTKARQKGTEMAWISVDDGLPEQGEPVLVYRPLAYTTDDPEVAISFYRADVQNESPQGVKHGFDCWCHPTHWTPIPPIPKTPNV